MSTRLIFFYYGEAVAIGAVDWKEWIRKRHWSEKCAVEYCLKLCSLPGKTAIHKQTHWGCCGPAPASSPKEALPQSCALTFATFHSLNTPSKQPSSLPVVISVLRLWKPIQCKFQCYTRSALSVGTRHRYLHHGRDLKKETLLRY